MRRLTYIVGAWIALLAFCLAGRGAAEASRSANAGTFVLPEGLTEIGESAFEGVNAEVIALPETLAAIGSRAFANCRHLWEIYIPESVTVIAADAFEGCSKRWLTIYGKKDSAAEAFADGAGFEFIGVNEGVTLDENGNIIMPPIPLP